MTRGAVSHCVVAGALCLMLNARAESVVHDESSSAALDSGAAWQGGTAPTASDVATFVNSASTAVYSFATPLSWLGLAWSGAQGSPLVGPGISGGDNSLTLGARGIVVNTETGSAISFDAPVVAATDQTWDVNGSTLPVLALLKPLTVNGALTLASTKDTTGCVDLRGSAKITGEGRVTVNGSTKTYLCLKGAESSVEVPLTVTKGNVALVRDTTTTYDIKDAIASAGTSAGFDNNGIMLIGSSETLGKGACPVKKQSLRFGADSKVTSTSTTATRDIGMVQIADGSDVEVNGGTVEQKWLRLSDGRWRQSAGLTQIAYASAIGRGTGASAQELDVTGGTYRFYRTQVGLANSDASPAKLVVSGGRMETTAVAANAEYGGLDIGLRCLSGELDRDGAGWGDIVSSEYASGRVELSGGVLKTTRIGFGGHVNGGMSVPSKPDVNSSAGFFMTGGELCMGGLGIAPNDGWGGNSLYKVVFSGGKVTTFESGAKQAAEVLLASTNVTYEIGTGHEYAVTSPMYGAGGLVKRGAGAMTLACGNDYTGATVVEEGSLYVGEAVGKGALMRLDADSLNAREIVAWGYGDVSDFTVETARKALSPVNVAAPTRDRIGAHPAVAFGGDAALCLTGAVGASGPKTALLVGMVFCLDPDAACGSSANWNENAFLIGQALNNQAGSRDRGWGVAVNDDGHVQAGSSFVENGQQKAAPYTLCNDKVNVRDGQPHVVFYSWSDTTNHTLWVDGQAVSGTEPPLEADAWTKTFKTRMLLGAQDLNGTAGANRFFKGKIAHVQFYAHLYVADKVITSPLKTAEEVEAYIRSLAGYYGARRPNGLTDATAGIQDAGFPAATTELVADSLEASAGATVTSWSPRTGNATAYSLTTAQTVMGSDATAPTVIGEGFNGHKAVRFDGVKNTLAVGGAGAGYMKNAESGNGTKKGFSVSMVVKFNGPGAGASTLSPFGALPFFGSTRSGMGTGYVWASALTANGRAKGGFLAARTNTDKPTDFDTCAVASSREVFLDDGRVHVIVLTFPDMNAAVPMSMTVDGVRQEAPVTWKSVNLGYAKTYMVLGGSNRYAEKVRLPCDVADIRFWPEIQLTEAQIRSLSESLATTYGADLVGYRAHGANGQQSARVRVLSGATYGSDHVAGVSTLCGGQTLSGGGKVAGKFVMASGSAVRLEEAGSPSFDSLTLNDGARIVVGGTGFRLLTLTNGLYAAPGDKIVVDCTAIADLTEKVTIAQCGVVGTVTPANFVLAGVPAERVVVRVSDDGKTVKVVPVKGLLTIVR